MPSLDSLEPTMRQNTKMREASLGTARTDFNYDYEDTGAWADLLNREHDEDWIYGIHTKMEQTGTSKMTKGQSQIDNFVSGYIKI